MTRIENQRTNIIKKSDLQCTRDDAYQFFYFSRGLLLLVYKANQELETKNKDKRLFEAVNCGLFLYFIPQTFDFRQETFACAFPSRNPVPRRVIILPYNRTVVWMQLIHKLNTFNIKRRFFLNKRFQFSIHEDALIGDYIPFFDIY